MLSTHVIKVYFLLLVIAILTSNAMSMQDEAGELKVGEITLPSGVLLQNKPQIKNSKSLKQNLKKLAPKAHEDKASDIFRNSLVVLTPQKVKSPQKLCDEFVANRLQPVVQKTNKTKIELKLIYKKESKERQKTIECNYTIGKELIITRDSESRKVYPSYVWQKIDVPGIGKVSVAKLGVKREIVPANKIAEYLIAFNRATDYQEKTVHTAYLINKQICQSKKSCSQLFNNYYFAEVSQNSIGYKIPTTGITVRNIGNNDRVGVSKSSVVLAPFYRAHLNKYEYLYVYVIEAHSDLLSTTNTDELTGPNKAELIANISKKMGNTARSIMYEFGKGEADKLDLKRIFIKVNFRTQNRKVLKMIKFYSKTGRKWISVSKL